MTLTDRTSSMLRHEVGMLRERESRRVFDTVLYVGTLGAERDSFVVRARDVPAIDTAVRIDVVSALLDRTDPALRTVWLTRSGHPEPYEQDLGWLAAAATAFAMHGRTLEACYAITKFGWRDVRTGEGRAWKRLRL